MRVAYYNAPAFQLVVGNTHGTRVERVESPIWKISQGLVTRYFSGAGCQRREVGLRRQARVKLRLLMNHMPRSIVALLGLFPECEKQEVGNAPFKVYSEIRL